MPDAWRSDDDTLSTYPGEIPGYSYSQVLLDKTGDVARILEPFGRKPEQRARTEALLRQRGFGHVYDDWNGEIDEILAWRFPDLEECHAQLRGWDSALCTRRRAQARGYPFSCVFGSAAWFDQPGSRQRYRARFIWVRHPGLPRKPHPSVNSGLKAHEDTEDA